MALLSGYAPDVWRIDGAFSDLPEFQRAFQCKAGSRMVRPPAERCEVW